MCTSIRVTIKLLRLKPSWPPIPFSTQGTSTTIPKKFKKNLTCTTFDLCKMISKNTTKGKNHKLKQKNLFILYGYHLTKANFDNIHHEQRTSV